MSEISLKTGKPMRKDACCINILTCEHYIKCVLPGVSYKGLFDDITGTENFLVTDEETGKLIPVLREYLLNAGNWVSNDCSAKSTGILLP